ncbi:MAG TPA: sigma-70 family RNA polymerase sigma factor [Spirochaetota bacterium]|nr:sigma-70 family RNA polymerase sigma factor [Spirochaetota bacterium]
MLTEARLREVYALYKKELFVYIYRFTHSFEVSEDILHDCFENLIKYSLKYDLVDVNIRSFLYRTAHNLVINQVKRDRRITQVPLEENSSVSGKDYLERASEFDELNREIYHHIQSADAVARSIFIMSKESGMSIALIASSLGISERTARRKLAGIIEELGDHLKKRRFL